MRPTAPPGYWLISRRLVRRVVFGAVLLVAGFALAHPLWLTALGRFTIGGSGEPQPADAILVLGGGFDGQREDTAARLYADGFAPVVITSGTDVGLPALEATYAELAAAHLTSAGVPGEAIIQFDATASTCDEALMLDEYARAAGWTRVLVVTDPFHTRRAGVLFRRVLRGSNVTVTLVAAEPSWFSVEGWWRDPVAGRVVASELIKLAYDRLLIRCDTPG